MGKKQKRQSVYFVEDFLAYEDLVYYDAEEKKEKPCPKFATSKILILNPDSKGKFTIHVKDLGVSFQLASQLARNRNCKVIVRYFKKADRDKAIRRLEGVGIGKKWTWEKDIFTAADYKKVFKAITKPEEKGSTSTNLQLVKSVLAELRHEYRFLREPSAREIAIKVGKAPEAVKSLLYELAPETGWEEQETEQAKEEAKESINLAGWKKWLQKRDESGKYSPKQIEELNRMARKETQQAVPNVLRRAKTILENYPELAPEAMPEEKLRGRGSGVVFAGLEPWPEETKKIWSRVFREKAPISGRTFFFFRK